MGEATVARIDAAVKAAMAQAEPKIGRKTIRVFWSWKGSFTRTSTL